ncbi:hypothetical protein [Kordia sp.]|uniref:hypothetical protein n=1 Tax=Kordia sp. TaxID=1965332 RepID=UPI003D276DB9
MITYQSIDLALSDMMAPESVQVPCTTHFNTYHITPDTNDTFLYSSTNGHIQNVCQHDMECHSYTVIELDCPPAGSSGSGTGSSSSGSSDPSNETTSGGGDNNNGSNTDPNDPNDPDIVTAPLIIKKAPCESNKRLEIDDVFKQKMTILKDRASSQSFETLFTVRTGAPSAVTSITDNFDYQHFQGSISKPKVAWNGTGITSVADFKGIIHSHFSDLLPVLSVGDLVDMYYIMKNNAAVTNDFFYGLVNSSGTAYILQIQDRAAFVAFGDRYLSTEGKRFKFTQNQYESRYNIKEGNSNSDNEKGFVKMLSKINSGLQVFKSTDTTYSDYKKLNYINSEVVESDCN